MYRKNLDLLQGGNKPKKLNSIIDIESIDELNENKLMLISRLLDFIKKNYKTNNVIFILQPNVEDKIYDISLKSGFKTFRLEYPADRNYKTKNHGHWNCYGHEKMANQVSHFLKTLSQN